MSKKFLLGLGFFFVGCTLKPEVRKSLEQDWLFSNQIQGKTASFLHQKFFGGGRLQGERYHPFFSERVSRVEGEGLGFASCHDALACFTGAKTVRLSPRYASLEIPAVIRLSFLMHEARHAEGFAHVICPENGLKSPFQGVFFSGKRECDSDENGAYGVQVVMLGNVSKYCTSCSLEVRRESKEYAEFLLKLILSEEAVRRLTKDLEI